MAIDGQTPNPGEDGHVEDIIPTIHTSDPLIATFQEADDPPVTATSLKAALNKLRKEFESNRASTSRQPPRKEGEHPISPNEQATERPGLVQEQAKNKYCHYHKDVGHDTNDCINLKRLLDKLAEKGMLNSYVMKSKFTYTRTDNTSEKRLKNDKSKDKEDDGNNTDSGFLVVISGGFASGGLTMKGIKQDAWNLGKVMQTDAVKAEPFPKVIISETNRWDVKALHNDPMVFIMKIANLKVGRILIDTSSSADIISLAALKNLSFLEDALQDITNPLVGFWGNIIHPVGRIDLPIRYGQQREGRDMVVRFLVVKELTGYNVILGRPTLNAAKAVIVPHLMLLKFERTDRKIGTIQGSQKMAKECNQLTVKPTTRGPKLSEPKE
ncbi:uncharacterized protein LOC110737465 [Chenopodium quinoa]|uniref:uncharacterized protein LOC110737465 n=1 Tax=Chenopodium quinoa TaxID=63459 RepID=UPI000B799A82|nr:uncharacterized protein LOC110737465 [Chenopodium quinoa]